MTTLHVTVIHLNKRAGGLELCQPRGDGAAEEGGAEVERDAGEPDDEHPEGDALRPLPQDLERVARDLLRQDGGAVQHAGQQVDLAEARVYHSINVKIRLSISRLVMMQRISPWTR